MREAADPPPKVVIVTMIEDPRQVRELMDLGASAYIVKSQKRHPLLNEGCSPIRYLHHKHHIFHERFQEG
jgi:DNA-binding NarL/FixJ family response regulator